MAVQDTCYSLPPTLHTNSLGWSGVTKLPNTTLCSTTSITSSSFHSKVSSIVSPLLLATLQEEHSVPTLPSLPFFLPELQTTCLFRHPASIFPVLFQAFTRFFGSQLADLSQVPLATLLCLLLKYMFQEIPINHWLLRRHSHLIGSNFFYYDPITQQLRLQVPSEYSLLPRLFTRLYQEVSRSRTVKIQPYLWDYILHPQALVTRPDESLVLQFTSSIRWTHYCPTLLRILDINYDDYLPSPHISFRLWQLFWTLPLLLPARDLWYRVLSRKVPHGVFLHRITTHRESPFCLLCHHHLDDFDHFILMCP